MHFQPVDGLVAARASSPGWPEIGLKRHCNTYSPGAKRVGASDCLKMRNLAKSARLVSCRSPED
jgi:hypothetical protein